MRAKLLYISAVLAYAFAVFHCFFWILFDWANELPKLTPVNGAIMEMFNIVSIFVFLFQGTVCLQLARKTQPFTRLDKTVLWFVGGFYFLRAAFGFPLFGFDPEEYVVVSLCLVIFLANLAAMRLSPPAAKAR